MFSTADLQRFFESQQISTLKPLRRRRKIDEHVDELKGVLLREPFAGQLVVIPAKRRIMGGAHEPDEWVAKNHQPLIEKLRADFVEYMQKDA